MEYIKQKLIIRQINYIYVINIKLYLTFPTYFSQEKLQLIEIIDNLHFSKLEEINDLKLTEKTAILDLATRKRSGYI